MCGVSAFGAVPSEAQQGYWSDCNIPFRDREGETTTSYGREWFSKLEQDSETNIMWMICLFAAGYRASSSLALKFQLLTSRSCFGNGGACIVDLIIHYWPDMVIEKHYKPRSYSTIFHRWWRWSLFILLAYRWKEPFDLNVTLWYQPLLLYLSV